MKRSGVNFGLSPCPQESLDPDNGTELGTVETELAREEEGEVGPTMGPHFRAAEQTWRTEFQIFPVRLGGWVRCSGEGLRPEATHSCILFFAFFLSCLECLSTTPVQLTKYLSTDTMLM